MNLSTRGVPSPRSRLNCSTTLEGFFFAGIARLRFGGCRDGRGLALEVDIACCSEQARRGAKLHARLVVPEPDLAGLHVAVALLEQLQQCMWRTRIDSIVLGGLPHREQVVGLIDD